MRKYKKVDKDQLQFLSIDASSGKFTIKELSKKYNIPGRKLYYIFSKYGIKYNLVRDISFITDEYRQKISKKLSGIVRSDETREKYCKVAAKREYKNNKAPGWCHTKETRVKIKESNINTYKNKPTRWIKACLDNPAWYDKLKEAAKHRPSRTEDHNRKIIESKVGMPYDEWLIIKTEFERYSYEVRKLTRLSVIKFSNLISGEKQDGYHLDHIVSIYDGFKNDIVPTVIAHYTNLRYIPAKQNLTKNKKSDKKIEILKEEYYASETKYS